MEDQGYDKLVVKDFLELFLQQIQENETLKEHIRSLEKQFAEVQKNYEDMIEDQKEQLSKALSMLETAWRMNRLLAEADIDRDRNMEKAGTAFLDLGEGSDLLMEENEATPPG